jgi:cytochrome c oxidase subunit 2
VANPYHGDRRELAEGRRLFNWYNCSGCHGDHAGGGMGPSLRDSLWYYGGDEQSIFRRNRRRDPARVDLSQPSPKGVVLGGAIMPALVLGGVWVYALEAAGWFPAGTPALTVSVVAQQWWWQVDYLFPDLPRRFRTANEIHIPVGRPVRVVLTASDVIHSFWVPRLQGKMDAIPGNTNEVRLEARVAGRYEGECAEFCGAEHARMRLVVVASRRPSSSSGSGVSWTMRLRQPIR